jgi:hypothetical protein
MRQPPKSSEREVWAARAAAGAVVVALLALLVYLRLNQPGVIVGWGAPIGYDDFAFEVIGVRPMVLGDRTYTVVTMRVHNRAKRVDFRFRPSTVVIEGADGRMFRIDPEGQRRLGERRSGPDPCAVPLPAGTTGTTALAYALPDDLPSPLVRIRHGGWIGAILDDLIVGAKAIRLVPKSETHPRVKDAR